MEFPNASAKPADTDFKRDLRYFEALAKFLDHSAMRQPPQRGQNPRPRHAARAARDSRTAPASAQAADSLTALTRRGQPRG
jgi:hypothetical protein